MERQEQSLWLCPVRSCNLTTLISATEGNRKPLHTHPSFFLLTQFSCTTSSPAHFRGWFTSFLPDLLEPVSDILPLSILALHPLLLFLSQHPSATLFLQHHLSRMDLSVFPQTKFFLRSKCTILVSLKSKTKLMIKGNISSFLTAPGSEFPRGRHFQRAARGLFHLLDLHFTPQASSSTGVFHVGPSMPNDNLTPLCEVVATVQREQAWKQQVRRKKAGRALRLEGTHLNPCHQTPNASSDEGGKEKKKRKKERYSACQIYSQHKSAELRCHLACFTHRPPAPSTASYKVQTHRHTGHLSQMQSKKDPSCIKSMLGSSGAV